MSLGFLCETLSLGDFVANTTYQTKSIWQDTIAKTLFLPLRLKDAKVHKVILGFLCVFVANTRLLKKSGIPVN